jgi:hypothetical protein
MRFSKSVITRLAAAIYLIAFTLRVIDNFTLGHTWPEPALNYLAWSKSVLQAAFLAPLLNIWLLVAVCSALAAVGTLLGNRFSQFAFCGLFGAILVCEVLVTLFNTIPYLSTSYENLIGDVATLSAGLVIALSFLDRSR